MLSRHPMAEQTHHDRALADLVHERNNLVGYPGMYLAASTEEGHVFDHEPGMADYHHDHRQEPEFRRHDEYFAESTYPVYQELEYNQHYRESYDSMQDSNMYRSFPAYSPIASHDWELTHKPKKSHSFDDIDEFETFHHYVNSDVNGLEQHGEPAYYEQHYTSAPRHHGVEEDGLDFVSGLRRMSFEGLKD